jgi:hypothetical protein
MTWFVESPWPAITLGVVLEVALAIVLVRTGRGAVLVAMAAVLAVTIALVLLERAVVTEMESIEGTLETASAALEANDPAKVLELFALDSPRRAEVETALSRFTVREARVGRDLQIRTNRLTSPPSASAYFTGRIEAHDQDGEVPYEHLIRKFKVTLHRDGDRWLLYDYAAEDPLSGRWTDGGARSR